MWVLFKIGFNFVIVFFLFFCYWDIDIVVEFKIVIYGDNLVMF